MSFEVRRINFLLTAGCLIAFVTALAIHPDLLESLHFNWLHSHFWSDLLVGAKVFAATTIVVLIYEALSASRKRRQ